MGKSFGLAGGENVKSLLFLQIHTFPLKSPTVGTELLRG